MGNLFLSHMKPSLHIFSDIYGLKKEAWISDYVASLESNFNIQLVDIRDLANLQNLEDEKLHDAFIKTQKIEQILQKLNSIIKEPTQILGFSLGGTLAWKLALNNTNITKLTLISSTRIRVESPKPTCEIKLFFAEKDEFKPDSAWLRKQVITPTILSNESHNCYMNYNTCMLVCSELQNNL